MTALSDRTIRERIERNELVIGGEPVRAKHCAYEFRAGRVVYGGTTPEHTVRSIDLTRPDSGTAVIAPTAVVWIRSREQVRIPGDMVGMWIQTNSLSRRGLLLLNSTLVEPGYEGYLSAHLVNLGSQPVLVGPNDTIAKLLFLGLDGTATDLVSPAKYADYDPYLDSLAAASTTSFLRISELVPDIKLQIDNVLNEETRRGLQRFENELNQAVESARKKILDVERQTFTRIGGGFVLGFSLALAFLLWMLPYIRNLDVESETRIRDVVRKENEALLRKLQGSQPGQGAPGAPAVPGTPLP
jgi:deoxycytidine triphosphate deaminase